MGSSDAEQEVQQCRHRQGLPFSPGVITGKFKNSSSTIEYYGKAKTQSSCHEELLSAQTVGGKFARDMSEYKNHLRLVHSNQAH